MLESSKLNEPVLYLASNSPRRRDLLARAGWNFIPWPADIDETPADGEAPANYVLRLAAAKALAAARSVPEPGIVLAADTAVVDSALSPAAPVILGKPRDAAEAVQILTRLRGRIHQVYTAVAVVDSAALRRRKHRVDPAMDAVDSAHEDVLTDLCVSHVPMRRYSDEEIQAYVATGDPLDKAGAYAIQHAGFHPVEGFTGCIASVMGLPLCHTAHLLGLLGVPHGNGWAVACLSGPGRECPADTLAR